MKSPTTLGVTSERISVASVKGKIESKVNSNQDYANGDKDPEKDLENVESRYAVVAAIDIFGYTELIQKLANRKDVSPQVIARSIEARFATLIDILTEYGGDITSSMTNNIMCVWRFNSADIEEGKSNWEHMVATAVLSCIRCQDILNQAQLWALEDLGDEFKSFKLYFRCFISAGPILETLMGIRFCRRFYLLTGLAAENAIRWRQKNEGLKSQITITDNVWNISKHILENQHVKAQKLFASNEGKAYNHHIISCSQQVPTTTIESIYLKTALNIPHSEPTLDFSVGHISTFISDRAATIIQTLKTDKKQGAYYTGAWVEMCCVSLALKMKLSIIQGSDAMQDIQIVLEQVLKAAAHFQAYVHKVVYSAAHKHVIIQTCIFSDTQVGKNTPENFAVRAIKFAICSVELSESIETIKSLSIGISSGSGYEGLLICNSRSSYRLISESFSRADSLAAAGGFNGILACKNVFEQCKNDPIHGIFTPYDGIIDFKNTYAVTNFAGIEEIGTTILPFEFNFVHLATINNAASEVKDKNVCRPVVLQGAQGSGKSVILQSIAKNIASIGFVSLQAECIENETYAHPLFVFTVLLPQIMALISSNPTISKKELSPRMPQSRKIGFNTASDRADRLQERAETLRMIKHTSNSVKSTHSSVYAIYGKRKLFKWKKLFGFFRAPKIFPVADTRSQENRMFSAKLLSQDPKKEESDIVVVLRKFLTKVGEDPNATLPLLNPLVAPEIPDTALTEKIGPDGRTMLLAGLLVRLLDKISETKPILLTISETQWMDSASWIITMNIIRRCRRVLIILTTTPVICWRHVLLLQINQIPHSLSIEIHGANNTDLNAMFEMSFKYWGKVDKRLIENIKHKTEGRRAFVSNIIPYLKDSKLLLVTNGAVLPLDILSFEAALPDTFQDLLLNNFAKIRNPEFINFLRCAAVVGRNFSLEEVCAVMSDSADTVSTLRFQNKFVCFIKAFDYYGMIEKKELGITTLLTHPFVERYIFVYSEMREAIYTFHLSDVEKEEYHLRLVRFYEKNITPDNEPTFLPLICFHGQYAGFFERDEILQHIQYLVMYGNFLCYTCEAFKEMNLVYSTIQKLIEKNGLEEILGAHLLSEIHIGLGHSLSYGLSHEINRIQSLRHLMLATQLLNFRWPRTEAEWVYLVSYEILFWAGSNVVKVFWGWRSKERPDHKARSYRKYLLGIFGIDDYSRDMKVDRLEHLDPILENMSKNLVESDAPLMEQLGCDLLVLNNSFRLGNYNSSSVRLLMSLATKASFNGKKFLALSFAERCLGKERDAAASVLGAFFWTSFGKWDIAKEWIQDGIQRSKKTGDFRSWLSATKQQSLIYLYEGNFALLLASEEERMSESRKNGYTNGEIAAQTTICCMAALRGDLEAARNAKERMQSQYRDVGPLLRAQFQVLFAHLELADDNFVQACDCIERMIELMPKIHYSNDTIFLCLLLSVLAIRNIYWKCKTLRPQTALRSRQNSRVPASSPQKVNMEDSLLENGLYEVLFGSKFIRPLPQLSPKYSPKKTMMEDSIYEEESEFSTSSEYQQIYPLPQLPAKKKIHEKKKVDSIVVRSRRDENGDISFTYQKSKAGGASSTVDISPVLRRLISNLLISLSPFQHHCLSEPFIILLKAMLKVYDPTHNSNSQDGPIALRQWVRNCIKKRTHEVKLLVALVAISCWKLSEQSLEFTPELNEGMAMLAEMGLDSELIF